MRAPLRIAAVPQTERHGGHEARLVPLPMNAETLQIEIFKPGTFTSVEGQTVTFTTADLASMAAAYDPQTDPAPLVIGHPKLDDPAWGWVQSLEMQGDRLVATVGEIEPAFAEALTAGRYKRISAQIYPKGHVRSPKPESPYLKHVGALGAAPPAVKGLKPIHPVSMSEEEQASCATIELELSTPKEKTVKTPEEISFAERVADIVARENALKAGEDALAAERVKAAKQASADLHADAVSFAEGLVSQAKLAPPAKDRVIFLIDALGNAAAAEGASALSFGEGDKAESPVVAFKKLFDAAQPLVSLGEHAKPGNEANEDGEADPQAIADQALSYIEEQRAKGKAISTSAAVRHVRKAKKA